MHAKIVNDATGKVKEVKIGFSWTTLFFGFLVPLVRGDFYWMIILGIIDILLATFTFGLGTLVFDIVMCFIYNKLYVRRMLRVKGYRPASIADEAALRSKGYL